MKKYFLAISLSFLTFLIGQSSFASNSSLTTTSFYQSYANSGYMYGLFQFEDSLSKTSGFGNSLDYEMSQNITYSDSDGFINKYAIYNGYSSYSNQGTSQYGWYGSNDLTISVWLYPYDNRISVPMALYKSGDNRIFYMATRNDLKPTFYICDYNANCDELKTDNEINLEQWNNIVFRKTGGSMSLWLNGVNDFTCTAGDCYNDQSFVPQGGNPNFTVGSYQGSSNWYYGAIDELAIWKIGLSDSNIQEIYSTYDPIPPITPLAITLTAHNTSTNLITLIGTCQKRASGLNQLRIQGFSGTETPNYNNWNEDPFGNYRGEICDCKTTNTFECFYNGNGLQDEKYIGIVDFGKDDNTITLTPQRAVSEKIDFSFIGIDWSDPTNFEDNEMIFSTSTIFTAQDGYCVDTFTDNWSACSITDYQFFGCMLAGVLKSFIQPTCSNVNAVFNQFNNTNKFPFNIIKPFSNVITSFSEINYQKIPNTIIGFDMPNNTINHSTTTFEIINTDKLNTLFSWNIIETIRNFLRFGVWIGFALSCIFLTKKLF